MPRRSTFVMGAAAAAVGFCFIGVAIEDCSSTSPVAVTSANTVRVTAAGLSVVDTQGVAPGSISILYSHAAAYFETDVASFIAAASALLRPGGLLIFNIPPAQVVSVMNCARKRGLRLGKWRDLGGMNGIVVAFEKRASLPKPGFVEWPSQGSGRTNRGQLEERHPHVSN